MVIAGSEGIVKKQGTPIDGKHVQDGYNVLTNMLICTFDVHISRFNSSRIKTLQGISDRCANLPHSLP